MHISQVSKIYKTMSQHNLYYGKSLIRYCTNYAVLFKALCIARKEEALAEMTVMFTALKKK